MNIKIRKEYKELLHKIEDVCINFDTTKSDNLMKIINMTKLKNLFNLIDKKKKDKNIAPLFFSNEFSWDQK